LLVLQLERDVRNDRVREPPRILDRANTHQHLGWDPGVELDVVLKHVLDLAHQRRDLGQRIVGLVDVLDVTDEERFALEEALDLRARASFHQHLHRPLGEPQHLDDVADRADREDVALARMIGLGFALRGEQDLLVAGHRLFERRE
jgi:hypothetical protein